MPALDVATCPSSDTNTFTPLAAALCASASQLWMKPCAMCAATMEAEHAVSITIDGPRLRFRSIAANGELNDAFELVKPSPAAP